MVVLFEAVFKFVVVSEVNVEPDDPEDVIVSLTPSICKSLNVQ